MGTWGIVKNIRRVSEEEEQLEPTSLSSKQTAFLYFVTCQSSFGNMMSHVQAQRMSFEQHHRGIMEMPPFKTTEG